MRPHRQQPNRLLCPWDSPGKNTGVGCHFLIVGRGESGLVLCAGMDLRLPLKLLTVSHAPRRAVCGNHGFFRTTHGGVSAPSNGNFTHRVAFEEVSGHRVLIESGLGNRGRLACGTTHGARLEFPRETDLILRCAGKAGNLTLTKVTQPKVTCQLPCSPPPVHDHHWRKGRFTVKGR